MKGQAEVKFWLNWQDQQLYVQNLQTNEVSVISKPMHIALFLNSHNLTVNQMDRPVRGRDVMKLFSTKHLLPTIAKRQKETNQ
jgi:hypothetical protein